MGAVTLSTQVIRRLGLSDIVEVELDSAETFKRYAGYDVIFLASLVGLEAASKQAIIGTIRDQMTPGSLLVVRTAHNLRTLLYPEVNIDAVTGLDPKVTIQPLNEVVNSVLILEKPCHLEPAELVVEDKSSPGVFARFEQFCRDQVTNTYHLSYNPAWHFDIDNAQKIYGRPKANVFVVRYMGEVLATAAIRPYDRDYAMFAGRYDRHTGGVWRFFISPHHKKLNLEQLLQDHLERFARQAGFTSLYAHDQRDIPGTLRKYIQLGYKVTYESEDSLGTVHFEKQLEHHHA